VDATPLTSCPLSDILVVSYSISIYLYYNFHTSSTMSGSVGFAEIAKPLPVANKSGKTYSRAEVAKVGTAVQCRAVVD
jgi:hypothetical protein